jgi:SAM-dependent methyltransferase
LRARIANRFIRGEGIEIGALGTPLDLPAGATVRYVDRLSKPELYAECPEIQGRELVDVDLIDNGETLQSIPNGSVDFIIANHFMEHCEDFLGTLLVHASKLRDGGVLFYAIPNRQFTFDKDRPNTPFEHLVEDLQNGPDESRLQHCLEWARLVEKKSEPQASVRARELHAAGSRIHFHAWDARSLFHCLGSAIFYLRFPGLVAHFELNGHEVVCVIAKESSALRA